MPRPAPRPELAEARRQGLHSIREAAALTGVSARMIRHYETVGLIPPAGRSFANYRLYQDADLHRLRFIQRARRLGFPMTQIGTLLGLWNDASRTSREVKALAMDHADALSERIREMETMRQSLLDLARQCQGDLRPECPILADLAGTATTMGR